MLGFWQENLQQNYMTKIKRFLVAVPGRLESSRLPNKLLLEIDGISIVTRALENCIKAVGKERIVFCTDHNALKSKADELGIEVLMTRKDCDSGSQRICSVINQMLAFVYKEDKTNKFFNQEILENTLIINVQADQPFLNPNLILKMRDYCFKKDKIPAITTPIYKLKAENIHNPNVVKTLINRRGKAIYFSRSPLPFIRGVEKKEWGAYSNYYGHVGIYGYRADIIAKWNEFAKSKMENLEKLEQLRLIDEGFTFDTFEVEGNHLSIDTLEQYNEAQKYIKT